MSLIALADALLTSNVSLGLLYFFPIVISAGYLTAGEIVATALLYTLLRELFGPFAWTQGLAARLLPPFLAYPGTGILTPDIAPHRKIPFTQAPPAPHD